LSVSRLLERRLGVLDQLLGEYREDGGERFDEGDTDFAGELWVPAFEVVLRGRRVSRVLWEGMWEATSRKSWGSPLRRNIISRLNREQHGT